MYPLLSISQNIIYLLLFMNLNITRQISIELMFNRSYGNLSNERLR